MEQGADKRKFKRMDARLEVSYSKIGPGSGAYAGALSYDISCGGLRIKLPECIPVNTKLEVEIKIAATFPITSVAHVKWIIKEPYNDQYQAGIQFENIPEITCNRIAKYLDYKDNPGANPRAYSYYGN